MKLLELSLMYSKDPIIIIVDQVIAIRQNPAGDCVIFTSAIEEFEVRESLQKIRKMLEYFDD